MYTIAIVLHATCALAAFVVGLMLILQSSLPGRLELGRALVALLVLMGVSLVIAILLHLTTLPTIKQFIFWGLVVLLVYMIWRGVQAITVLKRNRPEDQVKVVDHVGFILISLFDGFAIVTALDLRAPGWLVALIAVGAVVAGVLGINARKSMLRMQVGNA